MKWSNGFETKTTGYRSICVKVKKIELIWPKLVADLRQTLDG